MLGSRLLVTWSVTSAKLIIYSQCQNYLSRLIYIQCSLLIDCIFLLKKYKLLCSHQGLPQDFRRTFKRICNSAECVHMNNRTRSQTITYSRPGISFVGFAIAIVNDMRRTKHLFCITSSIKHCFIERQWMIYGLVYCLSNVHDNVSRLLQASDAPTHCDRSLCYNNYRNALIYARTCCVHV